jgi:hypothetical protein
MGMGCGPWQLGNRVEWLPLAPLGRGMVTIIVRRGLRKSPARVKVAVGSKICSHGTQPQVGLDVYR